MSPLSFSPDLATTADLMRLLGCTKRQIGYYAASRGIAPLGRRGPGGEYVWDVAAFSLAPFAMRTNRRRSPQPAQKKVAP